VHESLATYAHGENENTANYRLLRLTSALH
jgi:hypothetical protein